MLTPSTLSRRSRVRRSLAALLIAGTLGVVVIAPASASVGTKSLCDTIQDGNIGAPAPPQGSTTTPAEAKKSLKLYKKFAKSDAPTGVKKALTTIVATLKKLAAGTPPSEIWGTDVDASAYGKAAAKVSTYVIKKCVGDVIKDLPGDIPDITIPDIG